MLVNLALKKSLFGSRGMKTPSLITGLRGRLYIDTTSGSDMRFLGSNVSVGSTIDRTGKSIGVVPETLWVYNIIFVTTSNNDLLFKQLALSCA